MKSKIGIFRALDVRFIHAEFAASFHRLQPFFAANTTKEINDYLTQNKIDFNDIPLKPKFFFDPLFPLLKKTDFTPWLQFEEDKVNQITSDMKVFEIYEPYFFYSDQIARIAKRKNIALVTEIWTSFPTHPSQYIPPYSWIVKNVVRQTDLFVLRSQRALSFLEPFKISENKKTVIYHGVNTDRFYPAKKHKDKIKILFVGALESHKGLDDLLDVFPRLNEKFSDRLELMICGEGSLSSKIIGLAKELPIKYLGKVSNQKLPDIYRSCNIYCQPSKDYYFLGIKGGEEFAGYTFMEAMASGLPIVSTYCGGIPEIIGKANTLITQGNKSELFDALNTYITSPELRNETGIQNRERAEELFNLSKQTKTLEQTITSKLV